MKNNEVRLSNEVAEELDYDNGPFLLDPTHPLVEECNWCYYEYLYLPGRIVGRMDDLVMFKPEGKLYIWVWEKNLIKIAKEK
jgi:hypothetical protein